jgi:hypothetical protein
MMKRGTIPIADIYDPIKRRATLEQKRVDELAASILDKGLLAPMRHPAALTIHHRKRLWDRARKNRAAPSAIFLKARKRFCGTGKAKGASSRPHHVCYWRATQK